MIKKEKTIDKFMAPIKKDVRKFSKDIKNKKYDNFIIALGKLKDDGKEPIILLDSLFGGDVGFLVRLTEILLESPEIRNILIQKNILSMMDYNGIDKSKEN